MNEQWHRDLPLDELLFDRWERARHLGFGEGSSIYHLAYVYGDVTVGANTWIGPYTMLDGSGGLTIGSWCSISAGVHVYTHDSVEHALTRGAAPISRAPVAIGDCCYVGADALIAKGVTIGDHVVIGAHAFVNRDVQPFTIVAGIPARRIGAVRLEAGNATLIYDGPESPHP
jgi:acetyltransferase-like isoleucine patch superfamily enzyme